MFDSNGEITPTLRGSYHGQTTRAIFQHTCFQPLTQQLEHSTIREPPRQRTQGSGGTTSAGCCGAWKVGAGADGASSSVCQTSILLQSSTGRPSRKTEGVPPRRNPMPSWVSWTMRLRPVPCVTRWATAAPPRPALRARSARAHAAAGLVVVDGAVAAGALRDPLGHGGAVEPGVAAQLRPGAFGESPL